MTSVQVSGRTTGAGGPARPVQVVAAACADLGPDTVAPGSAPVLSVLGTDLETGSSVVAWAGPGEPLPGICDLAEERWDVAARRVCSLPPMVPGHLPATHALIGPLLAAARLAPGGGGVEPTYDVLAFMRHQELLLADLPSPVVRPTSRVADSVAAAFGARVEPGSDDPRAHVVPDPTTAQVQDALLTVARHAWRFQPVVTGSYTLVEWLDGASRVDGLLAVVVA